MTTNAQPVDHKHVEFRPNRQGQHRAYIAGTRVRVQDVYVDSEIHGKSPDENRCFACRTFRWLRCMLRFPITSITVKRFSKRSVKTESFSL